MTVRAITPSAHVLTASERAVLGALEKLPSDYEVLVSPRNLSTQNETATSWYEPDFVVTAPDGRRVIIEVKSSQSLSLSNMAKLAHISRSAEARGDKFVVLVFTTSKPPPQRLEGLEHLEMSYVADTSDVWERLREVLNVPPASTSKP